MRYPFRTVAGTPAQQPATIGITMLPVPVTAPVPVPVAALVPVPVVAPVPGLVWANVATAPPTNTDPLVLEARYQVGWHDVPTNQLFSGFGGGAEAQAIAVVQNVPVGSVVTWSLDNVSLTSTDLLDYSDTPAAQLDVYSILRNISIISGASEKNIYTFRLVHQDSFSGVINVTISAYADAVLIGSLSLSVTAT